MIYQDVPLNIMGDSLRIKQVISNLLSNAIKFTQEGTIAVRIALEHIDNDNIENDKILVFIRLFFFQYSNNEKKK